MWVLSAYLFGSDMRPFFEILLPFEEIFLEKLVRIHE
jgi:hypothetical protein